MEISAIAVSSSGRMIATGQKGTIHQKTPEAPIIIWNAQNNQPVAVLKGMQDCVQKLAFSPDERFLAGIGANSTFIVWDTRDGSPIHTRITKDKEPLTILVWGDMLTDVNPKHPGYTLVTGDTNSVCINQLTFDISSMQYVMKGENVTLPNTGLIRNYTFAHV